MNEDDEMAGEQGSTQLADVRRMASWIGVELSRSRIRNPSAPGFRLCRVRGSRLTGRTVMGKASRGALHGWPESEAVPTEWTAYAFTLDEIQAALVRALVDGIPAAPADLWLRPADGSSPVGVSSRWTWRYEHRRKLLLATVAFAAAQSEDSESEADHA